MILIILDINCDTATVAVALSGQRAAHDEDTARSSNVTERESKLQ